MARMALSRAKLLLLLALVAFAGAQGVGGKDSNAPENPPAAAAPPAPPAPPPAPPATSPLQARGGEVVLPNKAEIIEIAKLGVEIVAVYTAISLVFRLATTIVALLFKPSRLGFVRPFFSLAPSSPPLSTPPHLQPSEDLGQPHTLADTLSAHWAKMERHAEVVLNPIAKATGLKMQRVASAFAESAVFHIFLRPVFAPAKLYASWSAVKRLRASGADSKKR